MKEKFTSKDILNYFQADYNSDDEDKFEEYIKLLLKWNKSINLTGLKSYSEIVNNHLPDPIILSKLLPKNLIGVDVGSGAGVIGIPLTILRKDLEISLIEPNPKKSAFLKTAKKQLKLNKLEILAQKVEHLSSHIYDLAMARAFQPPLQWIQTAVNIIKNEGIIAVFTNNSFSFNNLPTNLKIISKTDYTINSNKRIIILIQRI